MKPHSTEKSTILIVDDQLAIGVMRAIYEKGLTIPKDYSIVGFSDIPISAQLFPGLTTVNQFPYKTGSLAGEVMIKLITGKELEQKRIILEPKLSLRGSCAPL